IIGGTAVANPDAYPFVANIFSDGKQWCTGTRIAKNFIITAAHCKLDSPSSGAIVFANSGTKDTRVLPADNNEIIYKVVNQIVNPGYNTVTNENNDIMLIEIQPQDPSRTVPYNPDAVTLDDGSHSQEGQNRLAMGYGDINDNRVKASQLQEVTLTIANFQDCKNLWLGSSSSQVFNTQFCAGTRAKNVCNGDSGGPLFEQDSSSHVFLLGTVSFGTDCGALNLPSVYTKVSSYLDWINSAL
ncbi:trypsin-like serine protease, partial [Conidiobolus coronatus NRRL 28638]